MHRVTSAQWLPLSLDEAWDFFSAPENLDRITPDDLSFEILRWCRGTYFRRTVDHLQDSSTSKTSNDLGYRNTQCVDKSYFIDEQRFGPYKFWHHQHRFKEHEGGVLMEDILHYALPGGALGELVGGPMIHKKVKGIFEFREKELTKIFPGAKVPELEPTDA